MSKSIIKMRKNNGNTRTHAIRGVAVVGCKRNECVGMNVTGQGLEEAVFSY